MKLATLCYIRDKDKTLMLHRIKKDNDIHEGKWNGLGGKLEPGETPEECVIREVKEESGLDIISPVLKGVLTFPEFSKSEDWYVFLFVADKFTGKLMESNEGHLQWIDNKMIKDLPLWEGDHLFLDWLERDRFFSAKFVYRDDQLVGHGVTFY
ncbi:MAG: NUDIX domain-containing protein [Calditrichaceae bacterium]